MRPHRTFVPLPVATAELPRLEVQKNLALIHSNVSFLGSFITVLALTEYDNCVVLPIIIPPHWRMQIVHNLCHIYTGDT